MKLLTLIAASLLMVSGAFAQKLSDLPKQMVEATDKVNIHDGKIRCKVADGGACWGLDSTDKPFYKKKSFWVSEGIIAGVIIADNWSTERDLHTGFGYESNPLYGKHPSNFKLRTISVIGIGIESGLNIAMYELYSRQEQSKGWRYSAEWGVAGATAAVLTPVVIHNIRLYHQCTKAGLVCQ